MTDMIEKVEEAVRLAMRSYDDEGRMSCMRYEVCNGGPCACAQNVARAAIEAMMEPSEGMHEAGLDVYENMHGGENEPLTDLWQAMLKAALEADK